MKTAVYDLEMSFNIQRINRGSCQIVPVSGCVENDEHCNRFTYPTLNKIAKAHGTTVKALRAANGLKADTLIAGKKLKLPAPKTASAGPAAAPAKQP